MNVDCPECAVPMDAVSKQGIDLHTCHQCNGAWLPRSAIIALYRAAARHDEIPDVASLHLEDGGTGRALGCPACRDQALFIVRIKGVELDVCRQCSGIFFDQGEMAALRDRLDPDRRGSSAGDYVAVEVLGWLLAAFLSG